MTQVKTDNAYIYVITRKDLTFPQQAVQAGHAIFEAAKLFEYTQADPPYLVLTTVRDEHELLKWARKLSLTDIRFKVWQEPDLKNQVTAICSAPVYGDQRKFFSSLQLLKER